MSERCQNCCQKLSPAASDLVCLLCRTDRIQDQGSHHQRQLPLRPSHHAPTSHLNHQLRRPIHARTSSPNGPNNNMKITYKSYHAVASWRWDVDPNHSNPPPAASDPQSPSTDVDDSGLVGDPDHDDANAEDDDDESEEELEEEDEMCGVCQQEFESACPACKVPGDDCPLSTSGSSWIGKKERLMDSVLPL
jgi:hypothetical protein